PEHPQAQDRSLAQTSSERAFPLHADAGLLAQPGRNLVLDPARKVAAWRLVHFRRPTPRSHRCLHRNLQPTRQAIRLDQSQGPSKTHQSPFRGTVIPGTSSCELKSRRLSTAEVLTTTKKEWPRPTSRRRRFRFFLTWLTHLTTCALSAL